MLTLIMTAALVDGYSPAKAASLKQETSPEWTLAGDARGDNYGLSLIGADVNGDGYSDLIVGSTGYPFENKEGKVYVYHGSPTGLSISPNWTFFGQEETSARIGWSLANAGDVNRDGFEDVLIGAPGAGYHGQAYLFYGSPNGLEEQAGWQISGEDFDNTGSAVGAGDVNGDGLIDLVIGVSHVQAGKGAINVYYANADGTLDTISDWSAYGIERNDHFGSTLAIGDPNNDGFSDIAIGGEGQKSAGLAVLFLGGPDGVIEKASWAYLPKEMLWKAGAALAFGDTNGDGRDDLMVGFPGYEFQSGGAALFLGTDDGLTKGFEWSVKGDDGINRMGQSIAMLPRISEDGYLLNDIVVGSDAYPSYDERGRVYRFAGGAESPSSKSFWAVEGETEGDRLGERVANIGDVNGDGAMDLAVSAPGYDAERGKVMVYYGTDVVGKSNQSLALGNAVPSQTDQTNGPSSNNQSSNSQSANELDSGLRDRVRGLTNVSTQATSNESTNTSNSGTGGANVDVSAESLTADGKALAAQGDTDGAFRAFSQAIELDPTHAPAFAGRAVIYLGQRNLDAAVDDFVKAFSLDAAMADEYMSFFNGLAEAAPNDPNVYNYRGRAYYALNETAKALADFERAITMDPTKGVFYANRGLVYSRLGEIEVAIADYSRSIELAPEYHMAYYDRAIDYAALGEYQKAFDDYSRSIQLNPSHANSYNNRAAIYVKYEMFEEAIDDHTKALALQPHNGRFYMNRASTYLDAKSYELGLVDINRAIELAPLAPNAYRIRGLLLVLTERYDEGVTNFTVAIGLNPEFALAYLGRGMANYLNQSYTDAISDFNTYLEMVPDASNREQVASYILKAELMSIKE